MFELHQQYPELFHFGPIRLATEWNLALTERLIAALRETGLDDDTIILVLQLGHYTIVAGLAEQSHPAETVDFGNRLSEYPMFLALARISATNRPTAQGAVEFGIMLIEQMIAAQARKNG